jgi:hypothetical protein
MDARELVPDAVVAGEVAEAERRRHGEEGRRSDDCDGSAFGGGEQLPKSV